MAIDRRDMAAGGFFVAVGLLYGGITLQTLHIGSALDIGPGFFPLSICGALIGLGLLVALRRTQEEPVSAGAVPWRGIAMIVLACLAFGLLIRTAGMLPAVFVSSFVATLASPAIGLTRGLVLGAGLAVFCTAVFIYGIGLTVPALRLGFGL